MRRKATFSFHFSLLSIHLNLLPQSAALTAPLHGRRNMVSAEILTAFPLRGRWAADCAARMRWRIFISLYLEASDFKTRPFPPHQSLTRQLLAAARSRRGSDSPPDCHSLPRRHFATLQGRPRSIVFSANIFSAFPLREALRWLGL